MSIPFSAVLMPKLNVESTSVTYPFGRRFAYQARFEIHSMMFRLLAESQPAG